MMEETILFETIVGSHLWSMETTESDLDCISVFQQSTREILSGYNIRATKPQRKFVEEGMGGNAEYDYQFMEIGHLVNLLIKGNVNAIWIVTSPLATRDSKVLHTLRDITLDNLSKRSADSINGMAISQFKDSIKRPNMPPNKAYKTCLRTLTFGTVMFNTGKLVYAPVNHEVTEDEIDEAFGLFDEAYAHTSLPKTPNEESFRNFLYDLRVQEI